MSADFNDKRFHSFWKSVRYAISGLVAALKQERNFRIHLLAAAVVLFLAAVLSVSTLEFAVLILVIAVTLSLELMNTAIERLVDLITIDKHPLAKAAKDIAAGAVLIFCIASVVIGFFIFFEPMMELIQ